MSATPPREALTQLTATHRRAMWLAQDLLPALPDRFEVIVAEQRPRTMTQSGASVEVHDSTLLARRRAARPTVPRAYVDD